MPLPSLVPPLAACALATVLLTPNACAAAPPKEAQASVPPIAAIPVAPASTPTPTSTATPTPSLLVVASDSSVLRPGAPEAMPAPAPSAHVVLVDERPFRASSSRAREEPEHARGHSRKRGRHGRPYHPAPGIVVDVVDAQGGAGAAEVQRVARSSGYWPFRRCYEEGLRRDQRLSGKVSLELAMAASGAVDSATVTSSTLHDESVVLCVAREGRHLVLASSESLATAKIDVTLSTGDEPVPAPHAAPHAEQLREALQASWPAVRQCYASELAKRPDVGGRMELRFTVKANGEIVEVAEGDTRFGDVDVTRCVLGVYRTAKLAAIRHGAHETTFAYAVHFEARPPDSR